MPPRLGNRWLTAREADEAALAARPELHAAWNAAVPAVTIGLAVAKYRYDHQLTQTALGERLGMTQPQVARLEDGEHTPTLDTLCRLADTLGLDIELRIGPREDGKRDVPKNLQKGVWEASDQVIVAIRERPARR